jgi:hypothetical protein
MAVLMTVLAAAQIPPKTPPVSPLPGTLPGVPMPPGIYNKSQCPSGKSGQLTNPANYIRAAQIPSSWPVGQIVTGNLNFTTNGKSPEYKVGNGQASEIDEEHSIWCLTYTYSSATGYTVQTDARWWHQKTEIEPGFDDKINDKNYDTLITVTTQTWYANAATHGQSTLSIRKRAKSGYRSLAMSSGVSLPEILTETGKNTYYLKGGEMGMVVEEVDTPATKDVHPMTAFLEIDDWTWGQWDGPYAGEISTINNYIDYHTKPLSGYPKGYTWLEVDAIWKTTPGPGQ